MTRLTTIALAAAAMLAIALPASAAEQTRETYREAVEPICKANAKANQRILAGVRQQVQRNKLKPAAAKFTKASRALKKTWRQLKAVPQPPADTARLGKWLKFVKREADLFNRTAAKLRAKNKPGALAMVVQLRNIANKANVQGLPFEFRHCRFEPSKFT